MARFVTLTIRYNMDDPNKSLKDELIDWIDSKVDLQDLDRDMVNQLVEDVDSVEAANDGDPQYWVTIKEG